MQNRRYRSGDSILLKPGALGNSQPSGRGSILSCLPEADGVAQYRVRFENENFERRIRQDDIDLTASPSAAPETRSMPQEKTASWINSRAISIRKR